MGMNTILMLIMGIAMTAIIGSQVAPSMIEQIKATKVEAKAINNQEVIFEAVKRYITMKQTNPTSLQDIIDEQFLNAKVNNNGFDGGYKIEIDGSKGLLKIKTTIEDPKAQEIFLNSFKNKFIPTRVGTTNEFETTFVIPTDIMHGRGLFMTGIPVQATPPTDTSLKYWYDTSGKEVALRMYDPKSETWKKVAGTGGSGSISEGALVDASGDNYTKETLPTTNAEVGEIKYAYDSTTNTIQEYIYTGNTQGWVVKGGGGSPQSYPKSCLEYKTYGITIYPYINSDNDGVYKIDPDGVGGDEPIDVYCDMTTDGGGWTYLVGNSKYSDGNFPFLINYTGINPTFTNGTFRGDQGTTSEGVCYGPQGTISFDIKFKIKEINFKATFDWYNGHAVYSYTFNYDGYSGGVNNSVNLHNAYGSTNVVTISPHIVMPSNSNRTKIELKSYSCQYVNLPNYSYVEYLKVR
ncbi:fibrinogen-like YCDxxxxGGGW domain-containing protein [Aliarcobacter cryaerophilus]|uniref:fibrinogen-like YCDxxxxGGGW domain-containing protein n=1 Tax=Aliarcobacter cryaerophilus TaxID=28198 RepID=UPI003BB223A1